MRFACSGNMEDWSTTQSCASMSTWSGTPNPTSTLKTSTSLDLLTLGLMIRRPWHLTQFPGRLFYFHSLQKVSLQGDHTKDHPEDGSWRIFPLLHLHPDVSGGWPCFHTESRDLALAVPNDREHVRKDRSRHWKAWHWNSPHWPPVVLLPWQKGVSRGLAGWSWGSRSVHRGAISQGVTEASSLCPLQADGGWWRLPGLRLSQYQPALDGRREGHWDLHRSVSAGAWSDLRGCSKWWGELDQQLSGFYISFPGAHIQNSPLVRTLGSLPPRHWTAPVQGNPQINAKHWTHSFRNASTMYAKWPMNSGSCTQQTAPNTATPTCFPTRWTSLPLERSLPRSLPGTNSPTQRLSLLEARVGCCQPSSPPDESWITWRRKNTETAKQKQGKH